MCCVRGVRYYEQTVYYYWLSLILALYAVCSFMFFTQTKRQLIVIWNTPADHANTCVIQKRSRIMCTDYAQGDVGAVIRISWDVNFQGTPRLGKRLTPPGGGG